MDARATASRIVVAVSPAVRQRVRAIVPKCELRFVDTADALMRELHESTAVSVLQRVLAREATFPVICVRGKPSRLAECSLRALRMALNELGASYFIDLLEYPDDDAGNARVRALIQARRGGCGARR